MKFLILSTLILAFSGYTQAGELIDKTINVSATADITIEDPNGQIEIHGWNKNKVKVTGEISDQAKEVTFEKRGDNVIFTVIYEGNMGWGKISKGKNRSTLKFYVPVGSRMEVSTINGDINVTGVNGGTSVESINGDITVTELKQRISLETINGSIITNRVEGKISIETINGNVNDTHSSGKLSVSTVQGNITSNSRYNSIEIEVVNGNLELQFDKIDDLSIDSVNGKVNASMVLNKKGEVSVSNVNGSINLQFNKDVSADFNLDAFVGGKITNKLTSDKADKQKFGPGKSLRFSTKGGSGRVDVNTVSGKIQVGVR